MDGALEDRETLVSFLKIIQKDAYRLENLIQEIILLSKDSHSFDYTAQEINLRALIEQIIRSYEPIAREKQLYFTINGPEELIFISKRELLQPILKNLIENAVNYSKSQGTIQVDYSYRAKQLQLSVRDQGIGIDREDQVRIFERFYRVDKARTRNSGGTGLGLAIVKDYTKLLGGTITVDSFPGAGSTFTITLPLETKKNSGPA